MGIRMDSIHAPTTTTSDPTTTNTGSQDLPLLIKRKDDVEAELSALGSVLDSHGVNMQTGLTTFDGFPRSDIDVAQIRTTRAQIIRLRNDHKALMSKIEAGLVAHFASTSSSTALPPSSTSNADNKIERSATVSPPQTQATNTTFASIRSIDPASPAFTAGLRTNDRIVTFGDADWLNHEKLSKVAQIVTASEGREVKVTVLRVQDGVSAEWKRQEYTVVPRRGWGGRGLLGCHLVPE